MAGVDEGELHAVADATPPPATFLPTGRGLPGPAVYWMPGGRSVLVVYDPEHPELTPEEYREAVRIRIARRAAARGGGEKPAGPPAC